MNYSIEQIREICKEKEIMIRKSNYGNYYVPNHNTIYWDQKNIRALNHELEHALSKTTWASTLVDLKIMFRKPKYWIAFGDMISYKNKEISVDPAQLFVFFVWIFAIVGILSLAFIFLV